MDYLKDLMNGGSDSDKEAVDSAEDAKLPAAELNGFVMKLQEMMDLTHKLFLDEELTRQELVTLHIALDYPERNSGAHITPAEIAKRLGIHPTAVSRMLGGMSKKHLVRREIGVDDRRVVYVIVTPTGEKTVKKFLQKVFAIIETAMKDFSGEEIRSMLELQVKFVDSLRKVLS